MNYGFTIVVDAHASRITVRNPTCGPGRPLITFTEDAHGGAILCGSLRYRSDLRRQLGIAVQPNETDAQLAYALFRRHGRSCLDKLEGDWSLVIFDRHERTFLAARDCFGGYPLFVASLGSRFVVGTSLRPILAERPNAEWPPEYFARFLSMIPSMRTECPGEMTVYRGIERILPGCWLEQPWHTQDQKRGRFWNWAEQVPDSTQDSWEARGDAYRVALEQSIRERSSHPVMAHLSGGIDSTAIALLVQRHVPTHTVSLTYDRLPKLAAERPFVEAGVSAATDSICHRILADDLTAYIHFDRMPLFDEPIANGYQFAMDRAPRGSGDST